jgi:hypothetical protein
MKMNQISRLASIITPKTMPRVASWINVTETGIAAS